MTTSTSIILPNLKTGTTQARAGRERGGGKTGSEFAEFELGLEKSDRLVIQKINPVWNLGAIISTLG
jgi:hypothetical protein